MGTVTDKTKTTAKPKTTAKTNYDTASEDVIVKTNNAVSISR